MGSEGGDPDVTNGTAELLLLQSGSGGAATSRRAKRLLISPWGAQLVSKSRSTKPLRARRWKRLRSCCCSTNGRVCEEPRRPERLDARYSTAVCIGRRIMYWGCMQKRRMVEERVCVRKRRDTSREVSSEPVRCTGCLSFGYLPRQPSSLFSGRYGRVSAVCGAAPCMSHALRVYPCGACLGTRTVRYRGMTGLQHGAQCIYGPVVSPRRVSRLCRWQAGRV